MRKLLVAALLATALLALPARAGAHEYVRGDSDYPLRYIAYALHPFGIAVEYTVLRPIHWVVSQPDLDIVFGHEPTPDESKNYFEWK
ncbi:MAG: hypothetical protein M1457_14040 [bacterium]|nr:hypothetical protein [bacterium]